MSSEQNTLAFFKRAVGSCTVYLGLFEIVLVISFVCFATDMWRIFFLNDFSRLPAFSRRYYTLCKQLRSVLVDHFASFIVATTLRRFT